MRHLIHDNEQTVVLHLSGGVRFRKGKDFLPNLKMHTALLIFSPITGVQLLELFSLLCLLFPQLVFRIARATVRKNLVGTRDLVRIYS